MLQFVVEEIHIAEAVESIVKYKEDLAESCASISNSLNLTENFVAAEADSLQFVFDWRPNSQNFKDIYNILLKVSGKEVAIKYV